jgi:hypothetical protein
MGSMPAFAAVKNYLNLKQNLMLGVAGQAFTLPLIIQKLKS